MDHTTLLLNCYAKLKDTEKLETFIKSGTNFDLETAITMCRQGGYHDQAVYLSKKHGEHDRVVDILIEDSKNYEEALDYIARHEPDVAYPNLMRYARVLLEHCPQETTELFIDYYTGKYQPRKDAPLAPLQAPTGGAASAVQNLASFIPLPYRQSTNSAIPVPVDSQQAALSNGDVAAATDAQGPSEYDVPKPRTAFSAFVDHPDQFIIFLEACLRDGNMNEKDKVDLHTTLFEVYLEVAASKTGAEKREWEAKAKTLIHGQEVSGAAYLHSEQTNFHNRYPWMPRTFSCCPTSQAFRMERFLSENSRVCASTYFARTLQRATRLVLLKR